MRKSLSLIALSAMLLIAGCEEKSTEPQAQEPESAARIQSLNESLLREVRIVRGWLAEQEAARAAGRAAPGESWETDSGEEGYPTGGMMLFDKGMVISQLRAAGVCQGYIEFISLFLDAFQEAQSSGEMVFSSRLESLILSYIDCLEPLIDDSESALDMGGMMAYDQCICKGEGSIFGQYASLVYATYGMPRTGDGYTAPGSPAGDGYGKPGSPAGEGYGKPVLTGP